MDISRRTVVALTATAVIAALAGCGAPASPRFSGPRVPVPLSAPRLVGDVETLHPGSLTATQVAADNAAFGRDLYARICRDDASSNIALSPASAAQALGMVDAGAVGPTGKGVSRVLHLPPWSPAVVAALHDQTAALGAIPQIVVTNHVFEQTGVRPTVWTLNDLRTAFGSDLRQVDFTKPSQAIQQINAVIDHDTDGLVPSLFDQPLDTATQTVLADAILLDAKWRDPFPEAAPALFHLSAGKTVTASLMDNSDGYYASRTADGWRSVVLPYQGNLQAVAMLPPASAPACAAPSAATMTALTTGASTTAGVVMPKLNLSKSMELTPILQPLGLPLDGDYTGLGTQDDKISEVVQKVVMRVDQKGTKAAAANGAAVEATSARVLTHPVVRFDRPYLMVIEDTTTRTPLFVAKVADPTQS